MANLTPEEKASDHILRLLGVHKRTTASGVGEVKEEADPPPKQTGSRSAADVIFACLDADDIMAIHQRLKEQKNN